MAEIRQEAATRAVLHAALGINGVGGPDEPSVVLARAHLGTALRMIRELAGPGGCMAVLVRLVDGSLHRFRVKPDTKFFEHDVRALLAAGYDAGVDVVLNDTLREGEASFNASNIVALRAIPIQFEMRWGETEDDFASRAFSGRFQDAVQRKQINPYIIRDGFCGQYYHVLKIETPIPLRDDAERARAVAVMRRIVAHFGGNVGAVSLPGFVPLAGRERINAAEATGEVISASRLLPHAPIRKLPSSLEALEQFAMRLEKDGASLQQ